MKKPRLYAPVEVDWYDSTGSSGWKFPDDEKAMLKDAVRLHRSIGYVIPSRKGWLFLAQSAAPTGSRSSHMLIPMVAVKRIRRIKA